MDLLLLTAVLLSVINTLHLCFLTWKLFDMRSEVVGLSNSTHQVVMPKQVFETIDEDTRKAMTDMPEDFQGIQ